MKSAGLIKLLYALQQYGKGKKKSSKKKLHSSAKPS